MFSHTREIISLGTRRSQLFGACTCMPLCRALFLSPEGFYGFRLGCHSVSPVGTLGGRLLLDRSDPDCPK